KDPVAGQATAAQVLDGILHHNLRTAHEKYSTTRVELDLLEQFGHDTAAVAPCTVRLIGREQHARIRLSAPGLEAFAMDQIRRLFHAVHDCELPVVCTAAKHVIDGPRDRSAANPARHNYHVLPACLLQRPTRPV